MRTDLSCMTIARHTTILEAIRAIDKGVEQLALVVEEDGRLVGVVSDGDIRRGILYGISLEEPVSRVMNSTPKTVNTDLGIEATLSVMQRLKIHQLPVVCDQGKVVGLVTMKELIGKNQVETPVVLMVGGLGKRLHPLTHETPKPMLPLDGQPILEKVIQNFATQGFSRFTLCLNYKADVFQRHFGDGGNLGVRIDYLVEKERLGTAGALALMPTPSVPFIVMNGDLLTTISFSRLLAFHRENRAVATMCVSDYTVEVPYGVIEAAGVFLRNIVEKPTHRFHINAGIYVLEPEVLTRVRKDTYLDMPQLLQDLIRGKGDVAIFPIHEYWLDIGRREDLERAVREWPDLESQEP